MRILLTGSSGLLGQEIIKQNTQFELVPTTRHTLWLEDEDQMTCAISEIEPDAILHCAAKTRPMKIHDEDPADSIRTNIVGTSNLCIVCSKFNIKMIYISTDYVYPGTEGPYKEEDPVYPVNRYAWSKLGGECAVRILKDYLILRCSFMERPFRHEKAFDDSFKSFDYVDEIVPKIFKLIELNANGTFNVGGPQRSIYEFAQLTKPDVKAISRTSVPEFIPLDTRLNITKLESYYDKSI